MKYLTRFLDLLQAVEGQQVDVGHEVHEATRRGDENVAAHLELLTLIPAGGATVDDARTQHSAVAH